MAKILDMPKLSPTMEEGVLATWHKKEGDAVEVDDLLAEVETDKATMEFRAFDKGTLLKLLVDAGASVKLGQPVAILGDAGEDVSELVANAGSHGATTKAETKDDAAKEKGEEKGTGKEKEENEEGEEGEEGEEEEEQPHTPRAPVAAHAEPTKDAPPKKKKKDAEPSSEKTPAPRAAPQTMRPAAAAAAAAPVEKGNILSRTERAPSTQSLAERASTSAANGGDRPLASPYVRKVARERGIDLKQAHGSGEHGRILPTDLESVGKPRNTTAPSTSPAGTTPAPLAKTTQSTALATSGLAQPEVRPLSLMRKTIARRLTQAKQTVPHFYLTIDVDAEDLVALRERINVDLAAEHPKSAKAANGDGGGGPKPDKISINDMIIKACAAGLIRVPECNAQYTDEAILVHKRVDISVAVAIPDGLVTPVVRNADMKSVVAIAREVRDLAARARAKKLKPEEMSDGTFSISNLGMFGIDSFSAVINPPEGAILAVGQVRDEPVVKDGVVKAGKKLALTLSCDHRVVDGAIGAAFLAELRDLLERPMRILTG